MRMPQGSPKLRNSSMPLLRKPATDPISSPMEENPSKPLPSQVPTEPAPVSEAPCRSMAQPRPVAQASSPRGQPDPSISNCLPPSTGRKAPVAPIITSPKTNPIPIRGNVSHSTSIMEQPGINAPTFTIRGAATAILLPIPSNQKQPTPVTTKQPSTQGAPTGPLFPSVTPKGRPSKSNSGPSAPPEFISATKKSSDYTQLKNLPENATEVARRISELPTLRPLRISPKKRLVGLDRGEAALEAALGQLRGETPSNPCGRCTRGKGKGPFQNCIVASPFRARVWVVPLFKQRLVSSVVDTITEASLSDDLFNPIFSSKVPPLRVSYLSSSLRCPPIVPSYPTFPIEDTIERYCSSRFSLPCRETPFGLLLSPLEPLSGLPIFDI
ncbi:hypothetical protein BKA61DRAFT_243215 [Leptodontidium sp. MPI-SDFR-AT-0119]|nr:hypothetical protein BKA61DRAFT_243215 [Leptodontidium sp. MPI-SDFR-AT-0119]